MSSEASRAEGGGPEGPDARGRNDDNGHHFHRVDIHALLGLYPDPEDPARGQR